LIHGKVLHDKLSWTVGDPGLPKLLG